MERVQLFEFGDLPWFPQVVRECMTDFSSFLGQRGRLTRLVAALPDNDYVWDIGRLPVPGAPTSLVYLIGRPLATVVAQ